MKLMQHPKHGLHNVYTTTEEEAMRENGWLDAEPVEKKPAPPADLVVEEEEPKRKPGRPRKEG